MVFARDGKNFPLELPHINVPDYSSMNELHNIIAEAIEKYEVKFKKSPKTIVFDSVSNIWNDIEVYCNERFKGYDIWNNVNKEITQFTDKIVNALIAEGYNVIIISHAYWDGDSKSYIETCKANFAKKGGFLGTVDYAVNIDMVGNKRVITHRNSKLARTLLEDMPEKEDVNNFDLQKYLEKIRAKATTVTEKWSI